MSYKFPDYSDDIINMMNNADAFLDSIKQKQLLKYIEKHARKTLVVYVSAFVSALRTVKELKSIEYPHIVDLIDNINVVVPVFSTIIPSGENSYGKFEIATVDFVSTVPLTYDEEEFLSLLTTIFTKERSMIESNSDETPNEITELLVKIIADSVPENIYV